MGIDIIFENLISNGSKFNLTELKLIKNELQKYINKDYSLNDILNSIIEEMELRTEEFLHHSSNSISGLSTSIYLYPNYKINIMGGSKRRNFNDLIDCDTLFDIASITKLYTGLLFKRLEKLDLIDRNTKINDITDNFNLDDYSIDDLINMRGIIKTPKRLDECKSSEEAINILKQTYIETNNKDVYNYTDMGLIILTYILEEKLGMEYDKIIYKYLINPLGLKATYSPLKNITGSGRFDNKPNDPKARILNKPLASAGIFTNSSDLILLSKYIFECEDMQEFCINKTEKARAIFGSYTHSPLGFSKTYVLDEFSKYSFAFEGYTGSIVLFDLINKIHNNILVNSVYEGTTLKPSGFQNAMANYQYKISLDSLKLFIIDKYFNKEQEFVKKIKV